MSSLGYVPYPISAVSDELQKHLLVIGPNGCEWPTTVDILYLTYRRREELPLPDTRWLMARLW
jgi:hypothetical protein